MFAQQEKQLRVELLAAAYHPLYRIQRKEFNLFNTVSRGNVAVEFRRECCEELLYCSGFRSVRVNVLPYEFYGQLLSCFFFKLAHRRFLVCLTRPYMAAGRGTPVERTKTHPGAQLQRHVAFCVEDDDVRYPVGEHLPIHIIPGCSPYDFVIVVNYVHQFHAPSKAFRYLIFRNRNFMMKAIILAVAFALLIVSSANAQVNVKTIESVSLEIFQTGTLAISGNVLSANLSYYVPQQGLRSVEVQAD